MTNHIDIPTTLTIEDLEARAEKAGDILIKTEYRGYTILFSQGTGDALICDSKTREQVDVTGLGVYGAKFYIDGWVDDAK